MRQHGGTAVIYHYFEKNETYRDNFIFFLARAWRRDLVFFIVIAGEHSIELPERDNIRYVLTRNFGHDFGSYAELAESGALDGFDRLIFVNCTVRGPFLPHYVTTSWTMPFLALLKDDVHLCGSTINILHSTRPYHEIYRQRHPDDPEPFSHVQSSAHAMTKECFAFLRANNLYAAAKVFDKDGTIVDCELAMSLLVRKNGWNIACLLPPYNALDYRLPHSEINPATETGHPQAKGAYFGLTPHPFELIFLKTQWDMLPPAALDFYSLMALQFHPLPSLDLVDARTLRARLTARLGGPLAMLCEKTPPLTQKVASDQAEKPSTQPAGARSRCIMVLGMHRSGTSALAGVLTLLGATPPKSLMEPHASNPRGFFESVPVRDFNDALLAAAGSRWDDWRPIDPDWFASPEARNLQGRAVALIDEEFGEAELFVLKDPRICRLLPFWRAVLERRGTTILALHTHRELQEVAASLAGRYGFDAALTHLLWLRHQLEAEVASRGLTRHFTSYDQLLAEAAALSARIAHSFDLHLPAETAAQEVGEFISTGLKHHHAEPGIQDSGLAPWYRDSFDIFQRWTRVGETGAERTRLDTIRAELDCAVPAFASLLAAARKC